MPDSLKTLKPDLTRLEAALRDQSIRPVESWMPDLSGEMDMVIKRDGSWWHEGGEIKREGLVKLFASILRKDEDGETYLVTPVEKWRITVEAGHFLGVRIDVSGKGETQRVFVTTNMDELVEIGPDHPITLRNGEPYIKVRGWLDALLTRAAFYDLADHSVEKDGVYGIWAGGVYFNMDAG